MAHARDRRVAISCLVTGTIRALEAPGSQGNGKAAIDTARACNLPTR